MAENVTFQSTTLATAPDATVVAADDVSGVKYQQVKLVDATVDSTSPTGVAANPLKVDASGVAVPVTDNSGSLTVDNAGTFAVQAAQSGTWTVQPGNTANTTAWKVDGSAVTQPTKEIRTATGTTSQVSDSASNGTILASNANRLGAIVVNDSSARLYLKCGSTSSTTDYTMSLAQHEAWEVPFGYTGIITGIWASDPNDGAARVTEFT